MGEELTCRLVTDAAGLAALGPAWEALEAADPECTPFNAFRWNEAWWARYGRPGALRVVVVEAAGRPVGIAPFHLAREIEHRVLRVPTLRFLGSGGDTSPDYLGVIAEPARREAVVARALDEVFRLPGWRTARLRDVRAGSALDRLAATRFAAEPGTARPVASKRVLVADLPGTWDEFRASLSTKRRKQLNHRRNRLERAGTARLSIASSSDERARAMDALIRLHRARWDTKDDPGKFRSEAYLDFHRTVVERFAATDELWLVTLELDGVIIGVLYLFRWRDELMFFQSGFDPEHEALSPGHVMFGWTYREAIERGLRRADMLKGEYRYKGAWARRETFLHDHVFHRPGPAAWLARARAALSGTLARGSSGAPAALTLALALGACGGSDGDSSDDAALAGEPGAPGIGQLAEPEPPADTVSIGAPQGELPDGVGDQIDTSGLRLVVDGACGAAGEEISASLFLAAEGADDEGPGTNVTAFAGFDQGLGNSIEEVSRTDDALRFRFTRPDLVALTATLEGRTLTRYFGAWPDGAPAASTLRKPAPAGCLWALRLPPEDGSPSFCAGVYSRGGQGVLGRGEQRLDVQGCETVNEAGLQIIELAPVGDD